MFKNKTALYAKAATLASVLILSTASASFAQTYYYNSTNNTYDPGLIDQTNLIQMKEYEERSRAERMESEKGKEQIEMEKKLHAQISQLPNKDTNFVLNSVTFKNNTVFSEEELLELICEKIGTVVTINDLIQYANIVTDYYQNAGYLSTIAYLPPQKVQDGNVEIVVMEGKYGNISIVNNNHKWSRDRFIKGQYLDDKEIKTDKILNVKDIQETLREINASGYMKGSVSLQDNEESAQYTDIAIEVQDRFPIDLDFRFDNQGKTGIGLNRFVIFAGTYNLTGLGDRLLSTTTLANGSVGQGILYSAPIGRNETKFNVGYTYSGVNITGNELLEALRPVGKSHNFYAGFSRRLVKTENYKMYGDISFDARNTSTTILANTSSGSQDREMIDNYRTRAIRANISNIKDDFYGKWFANVGASFGVPLFNPSTTFDDITIEAPTNKFIKLNTNIARLQVLPWRSMAIAQLGGQWTDRTLYSSEQMQAGGMATVRGYQEGTIVKDQGLTASVEVRTPVPFLNKILPEKLQFIDDSIRLAAFSDYGLMQDALTGEKAEYLMSVGGGLILKMTKYLSGNVYVGVPIGQKPDNSSNCRVHFTLTSNIL